ncbi:DUF1697 domain-containing protein [Phenylobacterium sp. VNQ135]|uniref:DUF1697 domain-containing protein n=1 Tax=Phenylobacterium sp. VNQ135 TaxID=3400922 RepID=UPI003C04B94F
MTAKRVAVMLRAISPMNLKMPDLKRVLEGLGHGEVQTLLTSGNAVVTTAEAQDAAERRIEAALAAEVGLKTEAFVRDLRQLQAAMQANPFDRQAEEDPSHLLVMFTRGEAATDLAPLAKYCTAGEAVALGPDCAYLSYPAGIGRSKLTINAIEKHLGVRGTGRNWNTVRRLAERLG